MEAKDTPFSSKNTLNLSGKLYDLSSPLIMGILNVTPDSFYDGGRYTELDSQVLRLEQMILQGADLIDIGGYSTRPGSEDLPIKDEIERIVPAIRKAKELAPDIPVSIDTFRSEVAKAALEVGADMVNDISGGSLDPGMYQLIADSQVPYVLMHSRGTPQSMSGMTDYQNLLTDIIKDLSDKLQLLNQLGVNDVIVDPGFGFAKDLDQNYLLLKELTLFEVLEVPILVGLSRKSMIYKALGVSSEDSLTGTNVLNTIALMHGASILRVHDVKSAKETAYLYAKTFNSESQP